MNIDTINKLDDLIGPTATTELISLETQIEELRKYLGVVRLAQTKGFILLRQGPHGLSDPT